MSVDVGVAPLRTKEDCVAATALLAKTWGTSLQAAPLSSDLIRSLVHSGNCALAARHNGRIVGVTVGVFGSPESRSLYSLIAAVDRKHASRGVGRTLKLEQRQWALERGATSMIWTFDPLIRRNAHFNINRLGADVIEFIESFYPPMHDLVNRGDETDRLTVRWNLVDAQPRDGALGDGQVVLDLGAYERPRRTALLPGPGVLLARIPADIERLRRECPDVAAAWRVAVRELLHEAQAFGYRISGFTSSGHYMLQQQP
jgi:predicted GNAT superfamily acetyltransferase